MKDEESDGGELVFALEGECGIESLDKMLDKILEGFETSDNAKKVEKGNRLRGGNVGKKKLGKKKMVRGQSKGTVRILQATHLLLCSRWFMK